MRMTCLITTAALTLTACTTPLDAPASSDAFGKAVASMQAQIIPAQVSDLPPEGSGARAAAAIDRYQKGEVRKLETQATSSLKADGGSSGEK